MLREIFYGPENTELTSQEVLVDAEPREVYIIACLLIPIIGIGLYPKLTTQLYDATLAQLNARLQTVLPTTDLTVPAGLSGLEFQPSTVAPELPSSAKG
jgi:NAD(P)H-quinone oxidoreductase subunit 4